MNSSSRSGHIAQSSSRKPQSTHQRVSDEQLPPRGLCYQWSPDEQIIGYRERMKIDPVRVVGKARWGHASPLPIAPRQIAPRWIWNGEQMDVDRYMEATRASGLIVMKEGEIVLERYGLGRTAQDHWDIQSVSKAVTALLLGAAVQDGYIESMDSLVVDYIQDLKGSAYEDVTLRQLATMTSGVKWTPGSKADLQRVWSEPYVGGVNPTVAYMRRLPRALEPGTEYVYSNPDADLAGILVSNAVGKSLSEYLSEKIWQTYGMEQQAYWLVDSAGYERGSCGISVVLRDMARIGQFVLDGGVAGNVQVVPAQWLAEATSAQVPLRSDPYSSPCTGFGYSLWTYEDHYAALGHGGQGIFMYPKHRVMVVTNSAWLEDGRPERKEPEAEPSQPNRPDYVGAREHFLKAVLGAALAHR